MLKPIEFTITRKEKGYGYSCPSCRVSFAVCAFNDDIEDTELWPQVPDYCIYCGARMEASG
jgi:hypothetical protein